MSSSALFNSAMVIYFFASVIYIIFLAFRKDKIGLVATIITWLGLLIHTAATILRWVESYQMGFGHAPLSNMYESMTFFAWSIILIYLLFEYKYKQRLVGAFVTPLAFLLIAYVSISPGISAEIEPLVPALQSNWLISHVVTCFLGYAAFAISFGISIMYLIIASKNKTEPSYITGMLGLSITVTLLITLVVDFSLQLISKSPNPHLLVASFASPLFITRLISWIGALAIFILIWLLGAKYHKRLTEIFPSLNLLDNLNYKIVAIGFPFLTLGIITGAAWANYAWGTYWSWDPKETWSLITWFVYAAFLHARFTAGWRGKKTAILSVIGFAAVLFTYLGVNFLLAGLHSYA